MYCHYNLRMWGTHSSPCDVSIIMCWCSVCGYFLLIPSGPISFVLLCYLYCSDLVFFFVYCPCTLRNWWPRSSTCDVSITMFHALFLLTLYWYRLLQSDLCYSFISIVVIWICLCAAIVICISKGIIGSLFLGLLFLLPVTCLDSVQLDFYYSDMKKPCSWIVFALTL